MPQHFSDNSDYQIVQGDGKCNKIEGVCFIFRGKAHKLLLTNIDGLIIFGTRITGCMY